MAYVKRVGKYGRPRGVGEQFIKRPHTPATSINNFGGSSAWFPPQPQLAQAQAHEQERDDDHQQHG